MSVYILYIVSINFIVSTIKVLSAIVDKTFGTEITLESIYSYLKEMIAIITLIVSVVIGIALFIIYNAKVQDLVLSYFVATRFFDVVLIHIEKAIIKKITNE